MGEEIKPVEVPIVYEESSSTMIAKEIIKNSIRSAICIDDAYAAPYSEPDQDLNYKDPKELFYSFRKDGHCDLDIYQYTNDEEWSKHKYLLHNKDLLVQDWELNPSPGPGEAKFDRTITILKDIFEKKIIPFVVIYTNREDLSEVSKELLTKFNTYNVDDFELVTNDLIRKFKSVSSNCEELHSFLEEDTQNQLFHEYIMFTERRVEIQEQILSSFCSFLEMDDSGNKITIRRILSVMKDLCNTTSIGEAILLLSHICLSKERKEDDLMFFNTRINIKRLCYSINGTIVLLVHKGELEGGVKPEELFEVFSQSVTNNPHSIINLISIELKDKFRKDFSKIGTGFNTIDESAFLYHAKNYYEKDKETKKQVFQKTAFKNFVVRSWIHELQQKSLGLNLDSFSLIEQEVSEHTFKEGNELKLSLANYASMVSCVKLTKRTNHKLGFGDIFKSGDHYFMCVTPLCDCINPSKVNNEFYFVKNVGSKTNLGTALKKAEQGYYSFITNGRNSEAIEWTCKPFTSYIPNEMNESSKKTILYSGLSYELEFVCSLKENYTQRISNQSFGQGYRVGIDLPRLQ